MKGWKIKKTSALCVLGGIVAYVLAEAAGAGGGVLEEGHILKRPPYGQGEASCQVYVSGLSSEEIPLEVPIGQRLYTQEEAKQAFGKVMEGLGEKILGENHSLMEVRKDLDLVAWDEEHGIQIQWEAEDPQLVDQMGQVYNQQVPPEGKRAYLRACLADGIHEAKYDLELRVMPPILSNKEEAAARYLEHLAGLDARQQTSDSLRLPKEYGGNVLHYRTEKDSGHKILLVLGIILAVLCYAKDQVDVQKREKHRERQLLADYPEIVSKLMVFIGAGMTVRLAWERIVDHYEGGLASGRKASRHVYEEMCRVRSLMSGGTPEGQAYGAFGRSCGLQCYRKLSSLLEQNRKAGTKNLRNLLQTEMDAAFEQRKDLAKRLGEEAGTKLLLPLFMMLGMVMVMIVAPAFLSLY